MEHGIETCYAGFAMETETLGGSEEEIAEVETEGLSPYQPKVDLKDAVVTEVVPGTHKMTKVSILTNMDRFEKLKKELEKIGIGGMTVSNVMGMGVEKDRRPITEEPKYKGDFFQRCRRISLSAKYQSKR